MMIDLDKRQAKGGMLAGVLTAALFAMPTAGAMIAPTATTSQAPAALARVDAVADLDPAVRAALRDVESVTVVVRAVEGGLVAAAQAAMEAGSTIVAELPIVNGFAAVVDSAAVDALAVHPQVLAITFDHDAEFHGAGGGSAQGDSWFEKTINADDLHAMGIDGSGVGIAILDSGVDATHPSLAGVVSAGYDATEDADGLDHHGHGTFLAGLAAGSGASSQGNKYDGVAPGAHIVPVKVGTSYGVKLVDLLEGLQWVHYHRDTHDIDVVNVSFGTHSTQSYLVDPLNYAVQRLWADGLVVVVSAGNDGANGPGSVTKPGDDPFVITVGSTDSRGTVSRNDDTVPAFSAQGPTVADGFAKPDIVAPGRSVIGPIAAGSAVAGMTHLHVADGWVKASGTSMSNAIVAGAAALLLDANPSWTPDQVKGALLDGAAPGPVGDPNVDGHGMLDVLAAANVTAPTDHNAGIPFGTGTGSLSRTLGLGLTVDVNARLETCVLSICTYSDATITVASDALNFYDASAYLLDWQGSQWQGSQWQGSQWQGSQWQGSQWQGSQWQNYVWQGSQWQGSQWQGSQWQGSQWQGNQWQGSQWQGSQWQGSQWQNHDW